MSPKLVEITIQASFSVCDKQFLAKHEETFWTMTQSCNQQISSHSLAGIKGRTRFTV